MAKNDPYEAHLKRLNARIQRDQNSYIEGLKSELMKKPASGQTLEEKDINKRRILNYVHKYVFLQKLAPIVNLPYSQVVARIKEGSKVRDLLVVLLAVRDVFGVILRIKTVVIIASAVFFFFVEYWFHYYTALSFKDINITFKTIIEKIPPFF
jgi:hypothetical protein